VSVCVFIGPTLPIAQAREILDAEYLPPVRQGDVYRAVARRRPRAIGIIDGYFHQVPSVWHKEILWAMAEGVHVFGSSSMGALRAAELAPFGMRGIGNVFAAFQDRVLEDDDEVAVIHGPPDTGYVAASEAMVNIRRTLADAFTEGVLTQSTRDALRDIAKSLFYSQRTYPKILKTAEVDGLQADQLSALRAWLERGRVDLKREDALAMLAAMRDLLTDDPPPNRVDYAFEHTTMWEAAIAQSDAHRGEMEGDAEREWLLDELRLDRGAYGELRHAALLRLLAKREAQQQFVEVSDDELRQLAKEFRARRGLHFGHDLDRWLEERDLDRESWQRLMADEALVTKLGDSAAAELDDYIIDQLRTREDYTRLSERMREKQHAILGATDSAHDDADKMEELRALAWYFEQRLGSGLPNDMDAYARRAGFASTAALRRAVAREYRFQLTNNDENNR